MASAPNPNPNPQPQPQPQPPWTEDDTINVILLVILIGPFYSLDYRLESLTSTRTNIQKTYFCYHFTYLNLFGILIDLLFPWVVAAILFLGIVGYPLLKM